jgi:hypothetical protein
MVGAGRFELPTPTTPLWCATRLRYAPTIDPKPNQATRKIIGPVKGGGMVSKQRLTGKQRFPARTGQVLV